MLVLLSHESLPECLFSPKGRRGEPQQAGAQEATTALWRLSGFIDLGFDKRDGGIDGVESRVRLCCPHGILVLYPQR